MCAIIVIFIHMNGSNIPSSSLIVAVVKWARIGPIRNCLLIAIRREVWLYICSRVLRDTQIVSKVFGLVTVMFGPITKILQA